MLLLGRVTSTCDQENFLHWRQFLVCSGKSQLSNYVNAHCLQISIWTWFMSYHIETTLCHDITTYDIVAALLWICHKETMCPLAPPQNQHFFNSHLNYLNLRTVWAPNIELSSTPPHVTFIPLPLLPNSPTRHLHSSSSSPQLPHTSPPFLHPSSSPPNCPQLPLTHPHPVSDMVPARPES